MLTGQYSNDIDLCWIFAFYGECWCGIGLVGAVITYGIRALGSTLGPWVDYARHKTVSQHLIYVIWVMTWVSWCVFQIWVLLT